MRRSKYGYLLLALLVITGLAGTITSTCITSKERKFAAFHLKDTKTDVLKSLKNFSRSQLNFKSGPHNPSIKESVYHLAVSEKRLWEILQSTMNQPANPEKRCDIQFSDDDLLDIAQNEDCRLSKEKVAPKDRPYKNLDDAIAAFKSLRTEHIKYIKTTTEDLRNHVAKLPIGWIDCYQLCLYISAHSNYHIEQIEQAKKDFNFPSR